MARPRKPTALKLLQGNPSRRPLNNDEPKSEALTLDSQPPADISEDGKELWPVVCAELTASGVLTRLDEAALALYCESKARYNLASEQVEDQGAVIMGAQAEVVNPWYRIMKFEIEIQTKLLIQFGMTPSSRSRVQIVQPKKANPFSVLLDKL